MTEHGLVARVERLENLLRNALNLQVLTPEQAADLEKEQAAAAKAAAKAAADADKEAEETAKAAASA